MKTLGQAVLILRVCCLHQGVFVSALYGGATHSSVLTQHCCDRLTSWEPAAPAPEYQTVAGPDKGGHVAQVLLRKKERRCTGLSQIFKLTWCRGKKQPKFEAFAQLGSCAVAATATASPGVSTCW